MIRKVLMAIPFAIGIAFVGLGIAVWIATDWLKEQWRWFWDPPK